MGLERTGNFSKSIEPASNSYKLGGRMKVVLRIYDFIKSWVYYPKMKQYLKDKCGVDYPNTRLQYSFWHCRAGMLCDNHIGKVRYTDVKNIWKDTYKHHPIKNN